MAEKNTINIPKDRILGTEVLDLARETANTHRFDNPQSNFMTQAYLKKSGLGEQAPSRVRIIAVTEVDDDDGEGDDGEE